MSTENNKKYIGESNLNKEPKKKIGLILDNGVILPRHLNDSVRTEYILPLINDAISGDTNAANIPYISIDSIDLLTDGTPNSTSMYFVTGEIEGTTSKVGILQIIAGYNKTTQLLVTHYLINNSGALTRVMSNDVNQYCRERSGSTWGTWSAYNLANGKQDQLANNEGILKLADSDNGPLMVLNNDSEDVITNIVTSEQTWEEYEDKNTVIPTVASIEEQGYVTTSDISNKANIEDIPTKVSDLDNDSGFVTASYTYTKDEIDEKLVEIVTGGDVDLSNYYNKQAIDAMIPEVPTNVSDFTNDAGYITSASIDGKANKVSSATSGNLAGLDDNGDLVDSGIVANYVQYKLNDGNVIGLDDYNTLNLITDASEVVKHIITQVNSGWTHVSTADEDVSIPTLKAIKSQNYVRTDTLNSILNNYALKSTVPDSLSDLTEDTTHRTVTDTEKETWNSHTSNVGTVTGIIANSTSYSPNSNGVIDLGSVGGIDDSTLVHKSGEETIGGKKTFKNTLLIDSTDTSSQYPGCIKSYNETGFNWIKDASGTRTVQTVLDSKQPKLISGQNISTINGHSLLTGEDIHINTSGDSGIDDNDLVHRTKDEVISGSKKFRDSLTLESLDSVYPALLCNSNAEGFNWIKDANARGLISYINETIIAPLVERITELEHRILNYEFDPTTSTLTFTEPNT